MAVSYYPMRELCSDGTFSRPVLGAAAPDNSTKIPRVLQHLSRPTLISLLLFRGDLRYIYQFLKHWPYLFLLFSGIIPSTFAFM